MSMPGGATRMRSGGGALEQQRGTRTLGGREKQVGLG